MNDLNLAKDLYMKICFYWIAPLLAFNILSFVPLIASETDLKNDLTKITEQPKYSHAFWGIYAKDLKTGQILIEQNSDKLFSPASTTKLFSVAALLSTFGDDYRFKTPVYASGKIENGVLNGDLILVAQGDLTFGGRQSNKDTISFTKMDHIIANEIPGVILTNEDPLNGINALAKQVKESGINEINGAILIDDTLFETIEKRGMILTPIMINENLIDIIINAGSNNQLANLAWRPVVSGYTIDNMVKTVDKDGPLALEITTNDSGDHIKVQGTIPEGMQDIIRTFSVKNPAQFAKAAFTQALIRQGIKINSLPGKLPASYENSKLIAVFTSAPLSEYAKLILKVSHNLGADLIPLLLASHAKKKTFDEGMRLLGQFALQKIKLSEDSFVFIDGAGGNENRLTPKAEIELLEYMHKQNPSNVRHFFDALPILGVDGSLEDFGKNTDAATKVRAKPGTGVAFNLATGKYFLITQAFAGYIEGKNGHLWAYIVVVNNASMPAINDVFAIFEDESKLSNVLYNYTN